LNEFIERAARRGGNQPRRKSLALPRSAGGDGNRHAALRQRIASFSPSLTR
jgi:hypothetical protein